MMMRKRNVERREPFDQLDWQECEECGEKFPTGRALAGHKSADHANGFDNQGDDDDE